MIKEALEQELLNQLGPLYEGDLSPSNVDRYLELYAKIYMREHVEEYIKMSATVLLGAKGEELQKLFK